MTLEEKYLKETGKNAIITITDGVHVVGIEVYSKDFVEWLKKQVVKNCEGCIKHD